MSYRNQNTNVRNSSGPVELREPGAQYVQLDGLTGIPVIQSFAYLSTMNRTACAALAVRPYLKLLSPRGIDGTKQRDEGVLVVWAESEDTVMPIYHELEHRLKHVARLCHCGLVGEVFSRHEIAAFDDYSEVNDDLFKSEMYRATDAFNTNIDQHDNELLSRKGGSDIGTVPYPDFLGVPYPGPSNGFGAYFLQANTFGTPVSPSLVLSW